MTALNNPTAVIGTVTWGACRRCLYRGAVFRMCLYDSARVPWAVRVDDQSVYCLMYDPIILPPSAT